MYPIRKPCAVLHLWKQVGIELSISRVCKKRWIRVQPCLCISKSVAKLPRGPVERSPDDVTRPCHGSYVNRLLAKHGGWCLTGATKRHVTYGSIARTRLTQVVNSE